MIRPMMKYSTNFIANQLVLIMAAEHYQRPANARDVQQYMQDNLRADFNWQQFTFQEGAGLSRKNRVSPQQLVQLLERFKPCAQGSDCIQSIPSFRLCFSYL